MPIIYDKIANKTEIVMTVYLSTNNTQPQVNEDVLALYQEQSYLVRRVMGENNTHYWQIPYDSPLRHITHSILLDDDEINQYTKLPLQYIKNINNLDFSKLYLALEEVRKTYPSLNAFTLCLYLSFPQRYRLEANILEWVSVNHIVKLLFKYNGFQTHWHTAELQDQLRVKIKNLLKSNLWLGLAIYEAEQKNDWDEIYLYFAEQLNKVQ